jgi:hypothetical protein
MNQLEEAIIGCTRAAQRDYEKMTAGWWLSHGPESFIMCSVANKLSRKMGFWVFVDTPPKRILKERDERPRGRPPKNQDNRFDMVVWQKASDEIRAVVEIKKAWNIIGLLSDRKKVAWFMKKNKYVNAGCLLAYTEAKGTRREKTLLNRLKNWADRLRCELVGSTMDARGDGEWGWAVGLFRL